MSILLKHFVNILRPRKLHDIRSRFARRSHECLANVVRMSCECRANVVRMPCECRANVVRMSCECRANVVRMSCECRANVAIHWHFHIPKCVVNVYQFSMIPTENCRRFINWFLKLVASCRSPVAYLYANNG